MLKQQSEPGQQYEPRQPSANLCLCLGLAISSQGNNMCQTFLNKLFPNLNPCCSPVSNYFTYLEISDFLVVPIVIKPGPDFAMVFWQRDRTVPLLFAVCLCPPSCWIQMRWDDHPIPSGWKLFQEWNGKKNTARVNLLELWKLCSLTIYNTYIMCVSTAVLKMFIGNGVMKVAKMFLVCRLWIFSINWRIRWKSCCVSCWYNCKTSHDNKCILKLSAGY